MWPIRDSSGDTIGFGARRIFDDDRIEAKYLNTPETPIYKKSQVLYGIDLARRDIARASQAVVVEGYTDVMACHLAGVKTAVATCGTAFGDDHARVIRRLLQRPRGVPRRGDLHLRRRRGRPEGRAAGLRGRPELRRPDLRRRRADRARPVRPAAPAGRRRGARAGRPAGAALPLRARQRRRSATTSTAPTAGSTRMREAARLVSSIRDRSKVDAFARELAGHARHRHRATPSAEVRRAADRASPRPRRRSAAAPAPGASRASAARTPATRGSPSSARPSSWSSSTRRRVGRVAGDVGANDFTHPTYRAVWELIEQRGGPARPTPAGRRGSLRDAADDRRRSGCSARWRVEPLHSAKEPDAAYVAHTSTGCRS